MSLPSWPPRPGFSSPAAEGSEGRSPQVFTLRPWGYTFCSHDGGTQEDSACGDSDLAECKPSGLSGGISFYLT